MREMIIAGLDVGSTETRLVVGKQTTDFNGQDLSIIGSVSVPTEGVSKGIINSIDDATSSLAACLEKAENLVGVPINNVIVSINDPYIKCAYSKGMVSVGHNNQEITEEDVERVTKIAEELTVPANYEILDTVPIRFSIDNQNDIKNPIGMNGKRLEVEALIVLGLSTQIRNLSKVVYRHKLEVEDLVIAPLAAAKAVLSNKQKELGTILVNLGASTTSIAVYEERNLIHVAVLPIGSKHITSDIALGLRCSISLAEKIKKEFGEVLFEKLDDKNDEIDISKLVAGEEIDDNIDVISRKYIINIINARVEEIFEKIDDELKKIDRSGKLPAGAVFVGGGSKLKGIIEAAKQKLRLPAIIGQVSEDIVVDYKGKDPEFVTALGLVVWGADLIEDDLGGRKITKNFNGIVDKAKGLLNKILPK